MDTPVELFDVVASIGGIGGVLALIVLYYARKDALAHKTEWASHSQAYQAHTSTLLTVIQNNTEAVTRNTGVAASIETAVRELRSEVADLRKTKVRHTTPAA